MSRSHLPFPVPAAAVAALALLLATHGAARPPLADASLAVVHIPSHGASGTGIAPVAGETLIPTVAHAFRGPARKSPLVILAPRPGGAGAEKKVGIRLAALDEKADLALVVLKTGPLPYVARVAPPDF